MDARYLRVKSWGDKQHYKDKEPKWIKAYAKLLRDAQFGELDEFTQWQLFRIWLVASQSTRFTFDETGRRVPVVAYDEQTLRRAIGTVKKIPLEMFVREGWLVPVAEEELDNEAVPGGVRLDGVKSESRQRLDRPSRARSRDRSRAASRQSSRAEEQASLAGPPTEARGDGEGLPVMNELLVARAMHAIGAHAEPGNDKHPSTAQVLRSLAGRLPDSSLSKAIESLELNRARIENRAAYVVGALQSEIDERSKVA